MNKSHITDEQVDRAIAALFPGWDEHNRKRFRPRIRQALEAAFPDEPQQPAAFGKLVVTEEEALKVRHEWSNAPCLYVGKDWQIALQKFVNRHSIKPIAFADRMPDDSQSVLIWDNREKFWCASTSFHCALLYPELTHWIPASALPIPEPAVDAMESAWREYRSDWRSVGVKANRLDFLAGYDAAQQAGGAK